MKKIIILCFVFLNVSMVAQASAQHKTKRISAEIATMMLIDNDDNLWAWGINEGFILAEAEHKYYEPFILLEDVKSIARTNERSMVIKNDHTLWAWGTNLVGSLGTRTMEDAKKPVKILDNVKKVSLSRDTSYAITLDNELWGWGGNAWYALLEDDRKANISTPQKIMDGVIDMASVNGRRMIIKEDNTLWAWGNNDDGLLGSTIGNRIEKNRKFLGEPTYIMDDVKKCYIREGDLGDSIFIVKTDDTLWGWGAPYAGVFADGTDYRQKDQDDIKYVSYKEPVHILDAVESISFTASHITAILSDHSLWGWGANGTHQIRVGDPLTREMISTPYHMLDNVISVDHGFGTTIVQKVDGSFWYWGELYGDMYHNIPNQDIINEAQMIMDADNNWQGNPFKSKSDAIVPPKEGEAEFPMAKEVKSFSVVWIVIPLTIIFIGVIIIKIAKKHAKE